MIGDEEVTQKSSAKLLGITIDETQNWNAQVYGKGGILASLNSRMFMIKRQKNQIGGVL